MNENCAEPGKRAPEDIYLGCQRLSPTVFPVCREVAFPEGRLSKEWFAWQIGGVRSLPWPLAYRSREVAEHGRWVRMANHDRSESTDS